MRKPRIEELLLQRLPWWDSSRRRSHPQPVRLSKPRSTSFRCRWTAGNVPVMIVGQGCVVSARFGRQVVTEYPPQSER